MSKRQTSTKIIAENILSVCGRPLRRVGTTDTRLWTQVAMASGNTFENPPQAPLLPHVVLSSLWSVGDPAVRDSSTRSSSHQIVACFRSAAWRLAKRERGSSVDTGSDFGGTGFITTSHLRVHSKATYATLEL